MTSDWMQRKFCEPTGGRRKGFTKCLATFVTIHPRACTYVEIHHFSIAVGNESYCKGKLSEREGNKGT